ncbi:MAG: hypothetical protein O7A09_13910 [Proteobacteria bacterium]|nr:hypothetical protein [Pseudomonadota bacterium]
MSTKAGRKSKRGGRRPGAGRPPSPDSGVSHLSRGPHRSDRPLLITLAASEELPSLRRRRAHVALCEALCLGRERFGFRLVHYGLRDHRILLIAEVRDRRSLARGMQGLSIRVAKALNRAWERKGKVFTDRYDRRVLGTPREVHAALCEVLGGVPRGAGSGPRSPDPYSSGAWFDGWAGLPRRQAWRRERIPSPGAAADEEPPTVAPRTALLRSDWRRLGRIPLP